MSKSPPALALSLALARDCVYVPAGTVITSAPASALASVIAALSEQAPAASAQAPFPGAASWVSAVVFTTKDDGPGLAVAVAVAVFVGVKGVVPVGVGEAQMTPLAEIDTSSTT